VIEVVSKENLNEVLPLIRQYQEFYKVAGTKGQVLQSCICVDRVCLWLDQ
jgi:hypothetical protein